MSQVLKAWTIAAAVAGFVASAPGAFAFQDAVSASSDADAQAWYETFTLNADLAPGVDLDFPDNEVEFQSGDGWGFTLGIDRNDEERREFDSIDAGVYVDLNQRFRFGGSIRFSNPDNLVTGPQIDERAPEVKFETGWRF
ncbi:NtrZ family periplasmic regulatory protein [Hyphobacterium sp.]|uniref:NtrZ family periplasmic regulatory protein n=1 Tax=Hyphobacterium sp. TaxID=2004662 RepID=UPI003749E48B